jgi:hypothetical protein
MYRNICYRKLKQQLNELNEALSENYEKDEELNEEVGEFTPISTSSIDALFEEEEES